MSYVKTFFHLNEYYTDKLADLVPKFGYNGFGEIVFYRTYSRIKHDGGQENWHDVVLRVINGMMSIRKDWYTKNFINWDERAWQKIAFDMAYDMFHMYWLPAGRGLWQMGTQFVFDRGSMSLTNCGATKLGSNDTFANDLHWMMDALMLGVGVGFEPTRDDLQAYIPQGTYIHYVLDSREGWADGLKLIVNAFMQPNQPLPIPKFDLVRGPGMAIKGFGGLSSGPAPLKQLYKDVTELMYLFALGKIDVVRLKTDIANKIGVCVVAGNVRRSAELCSAPVTDEVFMNLKDYERNPEREDWGYMSNNSADLYEDRDFDLLGDIARRVVVRGEPGIKNLRNMPYGRIGKNKKSVRKDKATLFNPCMPLSAKLLTPEGVKTLGEVNIGDKIWSKEGWTTVVNKWSTGINKVFNYFTPCGTFKGTINHRVLQFGTKIKVEFAGYIDTLTGPLRTDLYCQPKLKFDSFKEMIDAQIELSAQGILTDYDFTKQDFILEIVSNIASAKITHSRFVADEETFDITVDNESHTYWTGGLNVSNCGEIPLENKELCNIVETFPTQCPDINTWYRACKWASLYCTTVSLLPTHREETNKIVTRNRRIGVGIVDWTGWIMSASMHQVIKYMRKGYKIVRAINKEFSIEAGVPEAIRVTTIKPGGTTPKLAGKTSGIGYPTFRETLRRIRVASNNPICVILDEANIPFENDYFDPKGTRIYEYPTVQGPARPADEVSLWEQAMNLVTVQREWADNAVSNTLYFRPMWQLICFRSTYHPSKKAESVFIDDFYYDVEERTGLDLVQFDRPNEFTYADDRYKVKTKLNKYGEYELSVYEFDPHHEEDIIEKVLSMIVPLIKSCSLLPHSAKGAYRHMPEESLSVAEYQRRLNAIETIDWATFGNSDGVDEKFCQGETCALPGN